MEAWDVRPWLSDLRKPTMRLQARLGVRVFDSRDSSAAGASVIPLRLNQAAVAGAVLARAFQEDPIQTAMFPDPSRRAAVLPVIFTALIRAAKASDGHVMTTSGCAATAVWSPPGTEIRTTAVLRAYGFDVVRMVRYTPISSTPATMNLFATMARRRKAHVPEPHWYLATLGVDPSRHGQGLGSMLVREGLDRADTDGARTYLETETVDNVRFYRSLGFKVVEELTVGRRRVHLWLMTRDPD